MEKTEIRVNPLPSVTWHWTGMNDSRLEIVIPDTAPEFIAKGNIKNLYWSDDAAPAETDGDSDADRGMNGASDRTDWDDIETGMGDEFAGILADTPAAFLGIPEGYNEDKPAIISVAGRGGRGAGRIYINAGTGSRASVIIEISGGKDKSESDTMALQILLNAEEDAHLGVFVIQSMPGEGLSCLNIGGVCDERAEIELTDLSFGAKKTYIGIAMRLEGEKSVFRGDMGYHVKTGQSVDINYVTRHIGKDSVSDMNAWGVLEDASDKLFRGTIDFKEGCSGSKGSEKEDVLLRGGHQVNKTVPLILCHEEDVEGNHGATISRVDDEILFYLETRGIDAETGENMIAASRLEALINKIPDAEVRAKTEAAAFPEESDLPIGAGSGILREGEDHG